MCPPPPCLYLNLSVVYPVDFLVMARRGSNPNSHYRAMNRPRRLKSSQIHLTIYQGTFTWDVIEIGIVRWYRNCYVISSVSIMDPVPGRARSETSTALLVFPNKLRASLSLFGREQIGATGTAFSGGSGPSLYGARIVSGWESNADGRRAVIALIVWDAGDPRFQFRFDGSGRCLAGTFFLRAASFAFVRLYGVAFPILPIFFTWM